jgi:hypothetical protein
VTDVYVVSVDAECKELLFCLSQEEKVEPQIHAIELKSKGDKSGFTFCMSEERQAPLLLGNPLLYLFEPNASILKAGAFRTVAQRFQLTKLHANSHLYTGEIDIPTFPGRRFRILQQIKPDQKALIELLPDRKANLSLRNFPGAVDTLKKKLKIQDGGDIYVFATTIASGQKVLLLTSKL